VDTAYGDGVVTAHREDQDMYEVSLTSWMLAHKRPARAVLRAADVTMRRADQLGDKARSGHWSTKLYRTSRLYRGTNVLRSYQLEGLNWILRCFYQKRSCILADEMGLGKTVQVVTTLEHLYTREEIDGPFLIVVPLSTIEHWHRELAGWTDMTCCIYHDPGGGAPGRETIREYEWYFRGRSKRMIKFQTLVTTYDVLIKDYEELSSIPWRVVVVDEAHRLRTAGNRLTECLSAILQRGESEYGFQMRLLMTGTPLQNNTQELWSLLHFIEPRPLRQHSIHRAG